jgi:hypothetical protein
VLVPWCAWEQWVSIGLTGDTIYSVLKEHFASVGQEPDEVRIGDAYAAWVREGVALEPDYICNKYLHFHPLFSAEGGTTGRITHRSATNQLGIAAQGGIYFPMVAFTPTEGDCSLRRATDRVAQDIRRELQDPLRVQPHLNVGARVVQPHSRERDEWDVRIHRDAGGRLAVLPKEGARGAGPLRAIPIAQQHNYTAAQAAARLRKQKVWSFSLVAMGRTVFGDICSAVSTVATAVDNLVTKGTRGGDTDAIFTEGSITIPASLEHTTYIGATEVAVAVLKEQHAVDVSVVGHPWGFESVSVQDLSKIGETPTFALTVEGKVLLQVLIANIDSTLTTKGLLPHVRDPLSMILPDPGVLKGLCGPHTGSYSLKDKPGEFGAFLPILSNNGNTNVRIVLQFVHSAYPFIPGQPYTKALRLGNAQPAVLNKLKDGMHLDIGDGKTLRGLPRVRYPAERWD